MYLIKCMIKVNIMIISLIIFVFRLCLTNIEGKCTYQEIFEKKQLFIRNHGISYDKNMAPNELMSIALRRNKADEGWINK